MLLSASIQALSAAVTADAYNNALVAQKTANEVANVIKNSVSTLKGLGIAKIAEYGKADSKNTDAENKTITAALQAITKIKDKISDDVTIQDGNNKVVFTNADDTIKFTLDGGTQDLVIDTTTPQNAQNTIKDIFKEENKDKLDKLLAVLDKKIPELLSAKDTAVQTAGVAFAKDPDDTHAFDAYVTHQDALSKALEKDIADKTKDAADKKAEADKQTAIKNELKKAFDDAKKAIDDSASDKEAKIAAFNELVKKHSVTLENANAAGSANIDRDTPAVEADISGTHLSGKIEGLDNVTTSASLAAAEVLKTAKEDLKKFNDKSSDSNVVESKLKQLDPETPNSKAKDQADKAKEQAESQKTFEAKLKEKEADITSKVNLKSKTAESIKEQTAAVTAAKNALTTAANGADDAKKNAIADAIKAGVPVEKDGKKITEAEAKALSTADIAAVLADATNKTTSAETALNSINAETNDLVTRNETLKTANNELAKVKDEIKQASNARAKAITKTQNLDTKETEVLGSFSDAILSNETIQEVITNTGVANVASVARDLTSSFEKSSNALNKGISTEIINFNTGLATNTRLAKLANPYNADLALAKAINDLNGEAFADNGNSLSSIVKEYTNRFNHDNNLWGNIFGGKAKIKDSANPTIWGVTLGHDKAFDNIIVGGYLNYAKTEAKDSQVRHESDNYSLGVYSRSYFGENEIDAKIGYGFGKNDLERATLLGTNKGKYDSKFFDVSVDYGYVFGLGDAKFIKPMVGLSYLYVKNDGFTDSGKVPVVFNATSAKTLSAKVAAEFRAYADNGSYFYVTPGVEKELSKSVDELGVRFVGSSKEVVFGANKKKDTFFTLKTGAEFKITNSLSTNLNFGAKAKSKEQYYNGTLGISYKF